MYMYVFFIIAGHVSSIQEKKTQNRIDLEGEKEWVSE